MKIEENGVARYYSWWPSHKGRATPPTYGPKAAKTNRDPDPKAPNYDRQKVDRETREVNNSPGEERFFGVKSDKEMLQSNAEGSVPKHATLKFYFRDGLDVTKARKFWDDLLATNREYDPASFNCHMPVADALISAFTAKHDTKANAHGVPDEKAFKKLLKQSKSDKTWGTATENNKAWSVAKIARLCSEFATRIDDSQTLSNESPVIIRHNDFKNEVLTKSDYAPSMLTFSNDREGHMQFSPNGPPQKVTPRMTEEHHQSESVPDSVHFERLAATAPPVSSSGPKQ